MFTEPCPFLPLDLARGLQKGWAHRLHPSLRTAGTLAEGVSVHSLDLPGPAMRVRLPLALALCWCVAAADSPRNDEAAKKDLAKLQGTWIVVALENNGKAMPATALKEARFVVKDDRYTMQGIEDSFQPSPTRLSVVGRSLLPGSNECQSNCGPTA